MLEMLNMYVENENSAKIFGITNDNKLKFNKQGNVLKDSCAMGLNIVSAPRRGSNPCIE